MPTMNEAAVRFPETTSVTLTVHHLCGGLAGKQQVIRHLPVVIGRSHRCEVRLAPDDTAASGRHARLSFDGTAIWLEDLESTNGTRLNGNDVTRASLTSGDEIELGCGGPRLRITFDWPAAQWIGNAQSETYVLGTCEFPLPSPWRFPVYGLGLLLLLLPLWLGSLVAAVLLMPLGILALLLAWSMARINLTITPSHIEYQGIWQQVTLPWSEVTHLHARLRAQGRATYTIVGKTRRIHFRPPNDASGIELAQLIVRRTGRQWETRATR
ncbi:FHA domain-containing protein [Chloracidobacterium thermophilum]|nr:FHA domain-containing protein [Chloracidobacterium thermophilum]QUV78966.1 FHA domain-containing protein [Chloracidobacterium thermophilum]